MGFHPVFYLVTGWPSMDKTREMVRFYVDHGARALQFDMPSADPYGESDFIKACMKHVRQQYGEDFEVYMQALRDIRADYPQLEMHLTVYPDIVQSIGVTRFADFCNEIGFFSVLSSFPDELRAQGVRAAEFLHYQMAEAAVAHALQTQNPVLLRSNARYEHLEPRDGLRTWAQRINWLRGRGFCGSIYAVAGISTVPQLAEVKAAGADGAYIGSVLMGQWEDKQTLAETLNGFQALTEE